MELNTLAPEVKIVLDLDCVIRQATTANDVFDEEVSHWIGKPWADTVDEIGPAALSELMLGSREERVSPFFQVVQKFPSGLVVPFEYLVFCRDNGREFVAVGRDMRLVANLLGFRSGKGRRLGEAPLKEVVSSAVGLVERFYIEAALEAVDGNRTAAARILGISRQGFYDKLARYRIVEHPGHT